MGDAADDVYDATTTAYEKQMQGIRAVQKDCKYVLCSAAQATLNEDGLYECYCGTTFEL